VWGAKMIKESGRVGVRLHYLSPDGEMGFPGNLDTTVEYTLNKHNELAIAYHATTDKPTIVNLTNHAYFNFAGEGTQTVEEQLLQVAADRHTPVGPGSIPVDRWHRSRTRRSTSAAPSRSVGACEMVRTRSSWRKTSTTTGCSRATAAAAARVGR